MLSRPFTWPARLERLRSLARVTMVLAGAALVAFHGWLFAAQVAAGRLEDPWLVFRWTVAVVLIAALAAIRRDGDSIWSRRGIAVWVLAALLHGPAVATDFSDANRLAPPETAATSLLLLASATVLAVTLWMLAGVLARRDRRVCLDAGLVAAASLAGPSAMVSPLGISPDRLRTSVKPFFRNS